MKHNLDNVVFVSAPDGYRTLLSYGELFLTPQRNFIMLVDRINQKPIKRNGCFILITTKDLSADRWVKSVNKIEIKKVTQK